MSHRAARPPGGSTVTDMPVEGMLPLPAEPESGSAAAAVEMARLDAEHGANWRQAARAAKAGTVWLARNGAGVGGIIARGPSPKPGSRVSTAPSSPGQAEEGAAPSPTAAGGLFYGGDSHGP